jgi:hypothetical protein
VSEDASRRIRTKKKTTGSKTGSSIKSMFLEKKSAGKDREEDKEQERMEF